jgi:hypothetical protein
MALETGGVNETVSVTAEDNQITGCGYGVKAQGENLVLRRNVITGSSQWGVHCQDATTTMRDNDIVGNSLGAGVLCSGTQPITIEANRLRFNTIAIDCTNDASPRIHDNLLACNINYGIRNGSPMVTVDADSKWWGDSGGPRHPLSGQDTSACAPATSGAVGSNVSDGVCFYPWVTQGPRNPPLPFTLLEPPNGAIVPTLFITLHCEPAIDDCWDTVRYYFRYSTDSTFATFVQHGPLSVPYDTIRVSAGQTYFWRVLAIDSGGDSTAATAPHFAFEVPAWVSVDPGGRVLPLRFAVSQNAPNPFVRRTVIELALPQRTTAKLVVHDVAGRRVRTLVDQLLEAGVHHVEWDGRDDNGAAMPAGVYFYAATAGAERMTKRMILVGR